MDTLRTATLLLAIVLTGCTTTRVASPTPEPAALPAATIAPDQRVVAYPHGRWLLYGAVRVDLGSHRGDSTAARAARSLID